METRVFNEFDAFETSVDGIDSTMLLRDPERRCWTIDRIDLPGIEIQIGRLGSGNIACGQTDSQYCMFYLPLTAGIEYRGNGSILNRDSFFVLYPDAEFCLATKKAHDWCAVSIPIEQFTERDIASLSRPCCVARRDPVAVNQFQDIVANVIAAATAYSEFEQSQAAHRAASKLLDLLMPVPVQVHNVSRPIHGRPKITRDEIVGRSLAYLEEHRHEYPHVAELALASDVSERTLRTAFREYFGLGPSRFLQLRQLHDVRRALRSADPDHASVSQIMADYGVWAWGHFASRYRDLFGELPSATLHARASGLM